MAGVPGRRAERTSGLIGTISIDMYVYGLVCGRYYDHVCI